MTLDEKTQFLDTIQNTPPEELASVTVGYNGPYNTLAIGLYGDTQAAMLVASCMPDILTRPREESLH